MACRYREELVGKRFISVRSPQKLKIQKISEWEWRSGVVRAVSNRDTTSLDLSVLIEFDDIDWTRREWVRVHDIFQLFLVEHTLVWAERPDPDKPRISLSWPGLSFRAVVDKAGLAVCKRKPVEFLVDRFLGLVEEKEIQIFQEGDESTHSTATSRPAVQSSLKEWLDYQDGQKILLTTPTVLVGYRLEVYRAEGTTQWYTAVIQSYNHTSKTLSVTDDTVLEEHNEDPTIIQMHLIDEGVVDSILRGVEIGGIAPRRRPRQVKENNPQSSTNRTSANANTTPNSSRSAAQAKKPRTPQQQSPSHNVSPATSVPSVPSPSSLTTDKPDSKVAEKTVRPSARKKQKLDENSTKSKQPPSKVEVETSQPLSVETTTPVRVSPRNTPCKERSRPQRSRERNKNVLSTCLTSKSDTKSVSDKNTSESVNTTKARSCSKKDEKVSAQINQTGIESPKQENTSPRRRSQSRTPVHNNIESVINTNLSGSKKNRREVEDTKKVINQSAKKETSEETACDVNVGRENSEKPKACLSTKSISGISGCQTKVEQTAACTETVVEQKVQEIKSALKKREKESGINKTEVKEKKTRSVKNSGDKEVKKRERKKDNVVKDPTCASRTTLHKENCVRSACKDSTNESGDNMHYIKKKQSLLTGASETPNNNIPVPSSNIDVNRSVTDQVSRAEKLTSVNSEDNRFGSVSSTLSSPISERDVELTGSRDHRQVHVSGHSFNAASSSGSFTQDEHTFSRSSDSRCSSGLSGDEARRPGSRIDEIKSVKNSPASSPLIVDKSEPLQIYRDPELMSKNPVRSNVPIMHNSHKSYPNVHNPIPTPASRPSSVGMTSASLSNSLDRSSRAPVIPSVGYMGLSSGAAASLPGVSLSSLLPHGLHQLDPATLALHQQFAAVQQHQQLAAAALQQYNSLALSYPPHAGGLTKAQLELLWRQKYPHMQVPPPWPLTQHDDLVGDVRLMQEQEQQRAERDRMERLERERDLREREQRERKERERRERERMEKERLDRERREREKIEQERAEREREREKQEKERLERERLEREKKRILKETTVDSQAAVEQHFTKSLQQASQRAAQTGMWPQPSITLGTGKQKHDHQAMTGHPNKMGEIKPEEKIKQELQMETDTKIAEMMRKQQDEERILQKHQELMHKQGMYLQRSGHGGVDKKPDIKQENGGRDVKPVLYPTNVGSVKQERGDVGSASFSLYGYQPEKYSYISADQLQSYELDKKVMMDSKMSRPQSPKKGLSVPPPLIKDTKTTHNSVIVENKGGSGMQGLKSSSPHAGHYPGSHMSPHPQPKPAHTTPERSIDRPHSSNSSPGSHHGISPSMAHQHGVINMSRSGTSRSQSPLRIASPQQLSAAVMQPMDYRCSPHVSKNRGSPGSNLSPRPSSASSNHSPAFSPSIAQPPTSLPHSAVNFTYGLITQGLVPNPIYSTNNSKSSDSQRTVSVTGTAQVPCGPQSPSTYNQTQQPSAPGAKRKGQKEGTTRKRQKGNDSHSQMAGNPQNFSVPNTTPQIMTNSSPYTTSSANIPSAAMSISQTSMSPAASLSQAIVNNRLSGFTGFMDSFKSFVENTVQSAFMSDQEQVKAKDAQLKRPTPEQVQEMQLLQAQKSQPYKPKMSLERSCTPVASGQPTPSNPPPDEASNISNSSSNPNINQGFVDSINRVANGQIDTDSDTLSAPSPPPHLKQDSNNMQSHHHKTAKHPNLKKAWLQRHSEDDRNGSSKPPMFPAPSQSPSITPDGLGSNSGTEDKESVKNCFVNCSYISPRKEGGAKSPISAIQVAVLPNGPTEGKETPALTNDESTTSASEAENPGADNSANPRKRAKNKKETVRNLKKPKKEPRPEDQESNNSSSSNNATTTTTTTTTTKKVNRRSKESNKKGPDNMSEEQIKKIVETCKESVKDKEKGSKPTEEAFDKTYEFDDISEQKSDTTGDNDPNLSEDPQESESGKKNDKKEKKKIKEKKEKKPKKEKQQKEKKGDKVDEDSDASENVYIPPQPILKETELKAQQTTFSKPLVKQSDADLRKSCEPFLQDGSCSEVTPKLMKCRECKMTPTQRGKTVPNIFCRFYAFRRLKYSHRGFVTIDSFSELSDADQEDIDPWIPKFPIIEPKIDVETARFIIRRVGDKFCDLLQQEKDALMCTGENSKLAWKRAVTGVREMCDVCDTTLFNMHWVCHKCGFVVCLDCYKVKAQDGDNSESETDEESQEGSEGEEEKRKWLTCSANKQPHRVDKLMLTQIIPSDALWEVGRMMHETRERWKIQPSCPCSPKINTKKNGIKSELVNEAMKHASPKKKLMNGVNTDEDQVKKNGNLKSAVYNVENASPLDLLANVASMDSEKSRDSTESPLNSKKKEAKNGKSYNPITEPVSPGSSEKKMPSSCSTLRELLTKTAGGKVKNNSDSNKKKNKHNNPLKDIIQTVVDKNVPKDMETNDNSVVKSEVEQPMKLMHYTPRLGSSHILVRATPIIAHNLTETSVIYPDVPHSWLCDGRLLRLHEPRHKGNLQIFMEQWKRGQPVIVSNVHKYINQDLWKPSYFSKHFGEIKNDLINCRTGCVVVDHPMRHFWDGFSCIEERLVDEDGVPMLLKLKDWPPGDDFSDVLPTQFQDLMQALPLPEYTRRDGRLNLVSRLPDFLVKPDLGPKMYIAYGSAKFPKEGTTNLHLDVSDATNVMVHVGYLDEEERGFVEKDQDTIKAMEMARCDQITKRRIREIRETPGALWHIFDAVDADKIRDFLNKVAKERGEVIEQHHDPIHDQSWYLDEELRERLAKEYGVLGYTILQCLGDAVFIPAGAPHQVRNLNNCIKVAEDFVSPENIHHCFQLTQEFRDLSYGHSNHEDKLQIKNIVYHAVKDSTAVLNNADPDDYEDGD